MSKQGSIPEGITTTEAVRDVQENSIEIPKNEKDFINAIVSNDPKAQPELPSGSSRFLYDAPTRSKAPRSVYRETVHTTDGKTQEFVWWFCDNGDYVGRKEVHRIDPKTEISHLIGYDFHILATKDNLKKIADLKTQKTQFYRKYQTERRMVDYEEFCKS